MNAVCVLAFCPADNRWQAQQTYQRLTSDHLPTLSRFFFSAPNTPANLWWWLARSEGRKNCSENQFHWMSSGNMLPQHLLRAPTRRGTSTSASLGASTKDATHIKQDVSPNILTELFHLRAGNKCVCGPKGSPDLRIHSSFLVRGQVSEVSAMRKVWKQCWALSSRTILWKSQQSIRGNCFKWKLKSLGNFRLLATMPQKNSYYDIIRINT